MTGKKLLVYYSRSGKAEIVAKKLQERLGCDMDKLRYADREDIVSVHSALFESLKRTTVQIRGDAHTPNGYDQIILVSPVWKNALSTPIRSYMIKYKGQIASYSLVAVSGGISFDGVLKESEKLLNASPVSKVCYRSSEVAKGTFDIDKFFN